jgi:hypothetical protein
MISKALSYASCIVCAARVVARDQRERRKEVTHCEQRVVVVTS